MKARTGILGATTLALAAATALAAVPAAAAPAGHPPKAAAHRHQAGQAAAPFSSVVNTMGHTRAFIGSYAGQFRTRSGRLIVYVARPNPALFTGELQHLARAPHTHAGAYTVVTVRHSYAQLMSVVHNLSTGYKSLRAEGIKLAQWGPYPPSNKVQVFLETYSKRAVRTLLRTYGAQWIIVRHATEHWAYSDAAGTAVPGSATMPQASGETRFTDSAPYFTGDIQWYGTQPSADACTSGFAFTGKNTGNVFGMAAGHCVGQAGAGPSSFARTNTSSPRVMGQIQTQYWPGSKNDIASVSGGPFSPHVYGNGTTSYNILAKVFPGPGDLVTISGKTTGEVRGVTVENIDQIITVEGNQLNNLTVASKANTTVCQVGDSGGPWFVHNGNTNGVWAAGQQVAERIDQKGVRDPTVCVYGQIGNLLALVNGNLLTT